MNSDITSYTGTMMRYTDMAVELAMRYIPNLLLAIFTLCIGFWGIRLITKTMEKAMLYNGIDASLRGFLRSFVSIALKVLILISVATMVGVQMTSFVALIGAAGFAVGLALQGSLGNFSGGVLLLLFRPFRVGDFIKAQGHAARVDRIEIFSTILKTPDNKTVIIPNGPLSNGNIINYSTQKTRRVDMTFSIGYGDDLKKAKQILEEIVKKEERILQDPKPLIAVGELAESSVDVYCRVWCASADYWDVYFDMQEQVKLTFDAKGISIPYPQMDVHQKK